MNSEKWVLTALRALAEQDRGREAPEEIEKRLLHAFRKKHAQKRLRTLALAGLAAAAGIVIVLMAGSREQPKPLPRAHQAQPQYVAAEERQPEIPAEPAPRLTKARPVAQPAKTQPREVVTDFFPLLDAAPPFERGELLRVVVPASTMRRVGLPVNPDRLGDRIYADVLVGQEGLARAIRFVSYEQ